MIDISKINKRVTVESILESSDGCGGINIDYVPVKKIWCSIDNIACSESMFLVKKNIAVTNKIITRFDPSISIQGCRLNYNGRIFTIEIMSMVDDVCKWLELDCKEQIHLCRP